MDNWIPPAWGQTEAHEIVGSVVTRLAGARAPPSPAPRPLRKGVKARAVCSPCACPTPAGTHPPSSCPPGSTSSGGSIGTGSGDAGRSGSHGWTYRHARGHRDTHILPPEPPYKSPLKATPEKHPCPLPRDGQVPSPRGTGAKPAGLQRGRGQWTVGTNGGCGRVH